MSKLGIHISSGNRRGFGDYLKQCAAAGSPVPVIFSVDQNVWDDIQKFSPSTIVIFRTQHNMTGESIGDAPGDMYTGDPIPSAHLWMGAVMPLWRLNPATYYAPINEQDPGDLGGFAWLNAFTLECLRIAEANGFKLALYAFSAGNPKDVDHPAVGNPYRMEDAWHELIPSLQRAKLNGHILLLHEYGFDSPAVLDDQGRVLAPATTLRASAPHLALRYRRSYRYLHAFNADPPVVISEASAGVGGFASIGLATWLADAQWYDGELMKDKVVLGACLYQLGGDENIKDALPALAEYIARTRTSAPLGDPVIDDAPPKVERYRVVVAPGLRERAQPSLNAEIIGRWPNGALIDLDDQPCIDADGYRWRKMTGHAWCAEVALNTPNAPFVKRLVTPPVESFWLASPILDIPFRPTDKFNAPRDYANHAHEGLDLDVYDERTLRAVVMRAAQDGIVESIVTSYPPGRNYGLRVILRHEWPDGQIYKTWYCHLGRIDVQTGQIVKRGDPLGVGGRTGTTAIHLHFNVQHMGHGLPGYFIPDVVDPLPLLRIPGRLPVTPPATISFKAGVGVGHPQPLTARELEAIRISRVGAVKLLTLSDAGEMRQAIEAVRRIKPDMFLVVRLFFSCDLTNKTKFSPAEFIAFCDNGLGAADGAGVRHFEIHNEPNLEAEGYGWNWPSGREFNAWLLETLRLLRAKYPGGQWGYPGLSPQPNTLAFLDASREAARACDWIGAHAYFRSADQINSLDDGAYWRRIQALFPDKSLMITEFSNNSPAIAPEGKALHYEQFYHQAQTAPSVRAAFAFALSWPGADANHEAWVVADRITPLPIVLGQRLV